MFIFKISFFIRSLATQISDYQFIFVDAVTESYFIEIIFDRVAIIIIILNKMLLHRKTGFFIIQRGKGTGQTQKGKNQFKWSKRLWFLLSRQHHLYVFSRFLSEQTRIDRRQSCVLLKYWDAFWKIQSIKWKHAWKYEFWIFCYDNNFNTAVSCWKICHLPLWTYFYQ